jgi:uncharacterized C2H2 Zn-finger protein
MNFKQFFKGRYGVDNLTFVLFFISLLFLNTKYFKVLGVIVLIYGLFRTFSKNSAKRYQELQKFNIMLNKIKKDLKPLTMKTLQSISNLKNYKYRIQQRKKYIFLNCPNCKKNLRIPRCKGNLLIKCPVCKIEFLKKI